MQWISVNTYMPPLNADWLILRVINEFNNVFYYQGMYVKDRHWFLLGQESGHSLQVTHWTFPDDVRESDKYTLKNKD